MSGLVGYGSSDEEGGDIAQVASEAEHSAPKPTSDQDPSTTGDDPPDEGMLTNALFVGPVVPRNGVDATEIGPYINTDAQDMSDRDTIRYLTQATHPMTSMPPSPPGSPDPTANARFRRFLELKAKGVHFNEDLANKITFRNPSLLNSMMARGGLEESDQYANSLPLEIWDPSGFPEHAFKEQLLKNQQELREKDEMAKKSLSATGKRTIDFASAGKSAQSSRDSTPSQSSKRRKP